MSDTAPERIYLNLGNEETTYAEAVDAGWKVSWCEDQQDEWDVEYVRADLYEQRALQLPEAWFCEKCDEIVFKEDIDCG